MSRAQVREKKKHDIAVAAAKVFADRGFHKTGISDIANELGIGHGTFYRYFENKTEILEHAINVTLNQIREILSRSGIQHVKNFDELEKAVLQNLGNLYDLLVAEPDFVRLFLIEGPASSSEMALKMITAQLELVGYTVDFLMNGQESGFLSPEFDPYVYAVSINGSCFGAATAAVLGGRGAGEKDRWVSGVTTFILAGLRP